MLKKLTEEKLEEILETGISQFAEFGLQQTSMSAIAKGAPISVGVLYKYYENKDAFYDACVERCTSELDRFLQQLCAQKRKPLDYARELIEAVQQFSGRHRDHIRLYHQATQTGDPVRASKLAQRIEGIRAALYTKIISQAQESGDVRSDLDPQVFAFFFADKQCSHNSHIASQLLKFMESAFTLEQSDIPHR